MNVDGKGMFGFITGNAMRKDKNTAEIIPKLIKIFEKYGLNFADGMALLIEISSSMGGGKK